jgi:hypothetical protein
MTQIHDQVVFEPISIEEMTKLEKKRAMESLIFLTEKRDETVKARVCASGSTQRAYISREEAFLTSIQMNFAFSVEITLLNRHFAVVSPAVFVLTSDGESGSFWFWFLRLYVLVVHLHS